MSSPGETTLDTRGLLCPQPIIDLASALGQLAVGEEILILSDDMAFELDLRAWCAGTGHELLDLTSEGPVYRARVRKQARG
ncbi:sulfurtransferase TusA family protein [bacterium]|nr:MAG: sulfurtransferase TusA family protein [bacterium]RKZ18299.1 MAG: sulfurtransferase TusA family protein [bacterium]